MVELKQGKKIRIMANRAESEENRITVDHFEILCIRIDFMPAFTSRNFD